MERLIAELQRLYVHPGQPVPAPGALFDPASPDGRTRALAIVFERSSDWGTAEALCRGIAEELDLPAPAVSVSGKDGYVVWISLAEPMLVGEARAFLESLARRYLPETPPVRARFVPAGSGGPDIIPVPAACDESTGKWSAFIDPAMGGMFSEEPGLEMAPSLEKQADLLAGFRSIPPADFRRALALLAPPEQPASAPAEAAPASGGPARLSFTGPFADPKSFLLAVMNDPVASPEHRIRAAEALLPYFGDGPGGGK